MNQPKTPHIPPAQQRRAAARARRSPTGFGADYYREVGDPDRDGWEGRACLSDGVEHIAVRVAVYSKGVDRGAEIDREKLAAAVEARASGDLFRERGEPLLTLGPADVLPEPSQGSVHA